jgi:hypothetical protein
MAARVAMERLDAIAETFPIDINDKERLVKTAMTTLGSKVRFLMSACLDVLLFYLQNICLSFF